MEDPYVFTLIAFLTVQKPIMGMECTTFLEEAQGRQTLLFTKSWVYTDKKKASRISYRPSKYLVTGKI